MVAPWRGMRRGKTDGVKSQRLCPDTQGLFQFQPGIVTIVHAVVLAADRL